MNGLTNLEPVSAIVVYKDNDIFYLEKKYVQKVKDQYTLTGGEPLLKKDISDIFDTIQTETNSITSKNILSKNLLFWNFKTIIWYLPKGIHRLNFNKNLGLKSGEYLLPTLVFKLEHKRLFIYSTKTTNINENTTLFEAPVFNVHIDNSLCLGNIKLKQSGCINNIIKSITNSFLYSEFNNDLGRNIKYFNEFKRHNKIANIKSSNFNNKILKKTGLTLYDII